MWIDSGTKPTENKAIINLPNAVKGTEATALGLGYDVEKDYLYVRGSINLSRKIQKMYTGPDLNKSEVSQNVPNPLTKRIVMSQLMAVFDSCGLVALFRRTWQRSEIRGNNTDWDASIPDDLMPKWVHFVKEGTKISEVYLWEDGPTPGAPLWGHNGRRGTPTNLTIKTQTSSSSVESTVPNKSENSLLSCHVYLINMR